MTYESLKLTNNSKVRAYEGHNNTFSLKVGRPEDGGTCPGSTDGPGGCLGVCYAANLRKLYKNYAKVEDDNTALLKDKTEGELFEILSNTVLKWLLGGGYKSPYFRLHTAGDIFSVEYAAAWAKVIKQTPLVHFWVYTRSLFAVPILKDCKNLTIMLSCDAVNRTEVLAEYNANYKDCKNIAIAYMGDTLVDDKGDRPLLVCPEITGKLKPGKDACGACLRCRACVDRTLKDGNIRHIRLPIHR